jgi:O-antigen ligase
VVFAPWAYGTTQPWSISRLNANGWCLGLLWLAKRYLAWREGRRSGNEWPITVLGWLTLAILLYELLSILNAQATYDRWAHALVPRAHLDWLPGSLDPAASWATLKRDLALAGTFWAARSWLMGRRPEPAAGTAAPAGADEQGIRGTSEPIAPRATAGLGWRHRLLIGVLVVNALALGAEGLWQRGSGSARLLFRVKPRINKLPEQQFGPYAYRGNAVQYFSMIWPLGLGLWSAASRFKGTSEGAPGRLLLFASASAVGIFPLMTRSRMGAVVGTSALFAAALVLIVSHWRAGWLQRIKVGGSVLLVLAVGLMAGWSRISYRIRKGDYFADSGRTELRQGGWQMFRDHPMYGTGPGTFRTMYQWYRPTPSAISYAQMHCDWLETLATCGLAGMTLVTASLLVLFIRWAAPGSAGAPGELIALAWLGLGTCLLHATMDFPFQIYSIIHLFVVICALVSTLSLGRLRRGEPQPAS